MVFDLETAKIIRDRYEKLLKNTPFMGDSDNGKYFVHQVVILPSDHIKASEFRTLLRLNEYDWQKSLLLSGFDQGSVSVEVHCYYRPAFDIVLMYSELDTYLERTGITKNYSAI